MLYYVYILTNKLDTLYIGITNNLKLRLWQHKIGIVDGFTYKYKINKLIYFEEYEDVLEAIKREKQLKGWNRNKKIESVNLKNPHFEDFGKKYLLTQTS